jgi:hypothetical protein
MGWLRRRITWWRRENALTNASPWRDLFRSILKEQRVRAAMVDMAENEPEVDIADTGLFDALDD